MPSHLHLSVHLRLPVPVYPKLPKDDEIQKQRASTANQPTRIEKDILPVPSAPLSALASSPHILVTLEFRTFGLIDEYAQHICNIPHAREEEKQYADPFGAFAAVIEKKLGEPGAKIEECAEITEYLAPKVEVKGS